jgi:hypothetical protein
MGVTGITAQNYGAGDVGEVSATLSRALLPGLGIGALLDRYVYRALSLGACLPGLRQLKTTLQK